MVKVKKGTPITGWVNLNKPVGMGSTDAVSMVKRQLNAQKAGHGGTLDPLAEGVLLVALGEATKLMQFMLDADKTYQFTIAFGTQTTTDDAEGEPVNTSQKRPTQAELAAILPQFTGTISQVPPAYSAIKLNGKPAYARVRAGEEVEMKARPTTIHSLKICAFDGDSATLEADVSKGTYIRSLARDIGTALGCYGYVTRLVRTRAGAFKLEDAITPDDLLLDNSAENNDVPPSFVQPAAIALADIPAYVASPRERLMFQRGQPLQRIHLQPGLRKVMTQAGELLSIADVQADGSIKIVRNLNV